MTFFDRILKLLGYSEPIMEKPKVIGRISEASSCHDCFTGPGTKVVKLANGDVIYLCEKHYKKRVEGQ